MQTILSNTVNLFYTVFNIFNKYYNKNITRDLDG